MDFIDTVKNRHSTRDFDERPVSEQTINEIIRVAALTPSWANDQIWKVEVAKGNSLKQIKNMHQLYSQNGKTMSYEFPPLHRESMGTQGRSNVSTWSNDLYKYLKDEPSTMQNKSNNLFNAPAIAYLLMPKKSSLWSAYDLGAFGQTLMLAASNLGVSSMPAAEFVGYPQQLHKILNVSDEYQFGMGIGLGYLNEKSKINSFRSKRMNLNQFLTIHD
ncbi:nitroreductase [Companilactobacillus sp.]|jgi:nitroreductase|uniref:nitroreductase n=1 Tax=Companilactobacillus sp. TaxID=2767905 RepID=UPI0025C59884|nr:nitroreductase [Companilactobacillus sp.]MCH4008732.1 nitroreductase [Companilactobacillus sp.]MCH4051089.1 nitroreductase [Companilactobacillus sp.]MCH4076675.1 nitroreductase [Companilactobacillus sp.]MCH4125250.1 nitroreductase [Companilactobacillus sp.]MCH4131790.1 nitroreductase [Companilactobacillus sp.]